MDGHHVTPSLRGRQGRVLLAYLVLNHDRAVSRNELIAAIWPDDPPVNPAAALRTQLSRLRGALGPRAIAGRDAVELRLPRDTWIDIGAAEAAIDAAEAGVKAGDWRGAWAHAHVALSIAGRPFLAGFEAPWVEDVRRELEEVHLRARECIAAAGIGLGGSELAGAERSARALISAAPFRESGYLHLMKALVSSGNTAEAMRTYDELRKLLAEELGTAPGAEIQALHQQLLGGPVASDGRERQGPDGPILVERRAPQELPGLVREAVGIRIEELGDDARTALEGASMLGRSFETELVEAITDLSTDSVTAGLETAVSAGLLGHAPGAADRYRFAHPLFRQAISGRLSPERRTALQKRLAEVLEDHPATSDR